MEDKIIKKMFMSALLTVALMEFSQVGTALIDGIITAKFLGADAVASVGISYPYFSVCGVLSGCLASGLRARCTKEIGQGNIKRVNDIFSESVIFGVIVSCILFALIWILAPQLATVFGARGNAAHILEPSTLYLRGTSIGTVPFIMSAVLAPVVQIDNDEKYVRIGTVALAVVDIAFDLIAVMLGMGIWGIGLATALGNWAYFLIILAHFTKKERLLRFRFVRVRAKGIAETASLGTEVVVRRLANIIRPIAINTLLIMVGGSMALSVSSVRNNILDFVKILPAGMAGATAMLMSLFYGEANQENILKTGHYIHRVNRIISAVVIPLGVLLSYPIARFYFGDDGEAVKVMAFAVICTAVQSYFVALTLSRVSYLQSMRKMRLAQTLTMGLNLVYVVAFAYILGIPFGVYGVMASGVVSEFCVLLTIVVLYRLPKYRNSDVQNPYILSDNSLEISPADVISLDIRNTFDASLLSEQVQLFCKGHKIDSKTGYHAGMCAEEMALLSLENDDSKDSAVQIRVVISDGRLVLRFRDNLKQLNITKLAEKINESDGMDNLGLRMVTAAADEIQYYRTLESNNTLITLKI